MTNDKQDNPAADPNDQELLASFRQTAHSSLLRLVQNRAVLTGEELALALGVSQQNLCGAVQAGRLFGLDVDGDQYYPAFYATQGIDRTKLERVIKVLSGLGGWSQWQFFTTPKNSLGNITPLQALQRKRMFAAVLRCACGFAER